MYTKPIALFFSGALPVAVVGCVVFAMTQREQRVEGSALASEPNVALVTVAANIESTADVDALLSGVQHVAFDYKNEQIDRDPMGALPWDFGQTGRIISPPPPTLGEVVSSLRVQGILNHRANPQALVDDQWVRVGQTLLHGKVVVEAIRQNEVILGYDDTHYPLRFDSNE